VPFLVRWPGRVQTGLSDALVCQIDLLSSMAAMTGQTLDAQAGPDSFDVSAALLAKSPTGRDHLVEHAGTLSLIKGDWKYIEPSRGAKFNAGTNTELGNDPQPQLYNLKDDIGERKNVAAEQPRVVKEIAAMLAKIRDDGRSRPQ
jgi:arylsulfatase A-like enzyme